MEPPSGEWLGEAVGFSGGWLFRKFELKGATLAVFQPTNMSWVCPGCKELQKNQCAFCTVCTHERYYPPDQFKPIPLVIFHLQKNVVTLDIDQSTMDIDVIDTKDGKERKYSVKMSKLADLMSFSEQLSNARRYCEQTAPTNQTGFDTSFLVRPKTPTFTPSRPLVRPTGPSLPPPTVRMCFQEFCLPEQLSGANKYACQSCTALLRERDPERYQQMCQTETRSKVTAPESQSHQPASNALGWFRRMHQGLRKAAPSSPVATPPKQIVIKDILVTSEAVKKYAIFHSPQVVVLHLKRFREVGTGLFSKIQTHVSFPMTLDLEEFTHGIDGHPVAPGADSLVRYELFGVVVHQGGGLSGGHYVAYARPLGAPPTSWYFASDSSARWASAAEVLAAQAYLLFYQRAAPPQESSATATPPPI
jgi:hypothetical protein